MTRHHVIESRSSVFEDVAQVIGAEATRKLCEALGGTRPYIPRKLARNHEITVAIGQAAADVLAEHYHHTILAIPKMHVRRQRALELAKAGGMTIAQVALATDYTEAHIYYLLAQDRAREADGQLSLPGFLD